MPELPEVETVRRQLARSLIGMRFVAVDKVEPAMLRDRTEQELRNLLPGGRIETAERLGKFLILSLTEGRFLTIHLGMTGNLLVWGPAGGEGGPHTRFVFRLAGDEGGPAGLEFRDMRKFGRLHFTEGEPAARLKRLGPDAWIGAWDTDYLRRRLRGRTAPLKAFLLDQSNLAGIGNIYADEILWWTRLSPLRPAGRLSPREIEALAEEIPLRLGEGVRLLGCSIADFVDTAGNPGGFQEWLRAYGKQGQPCSRCGTPLSRLVVAGRGTTYCARCQK